MSCEPEVVGCALSPLSMREGLPVCVRDSMAFRLDFLVVCMSALSLLVFYAAPLVWSIQAPVAALVAELMAVGLLWRALSWERWRRLPLDAAARAAVLDFEWNEVVADQLLIWMVERDFVLRVRHVARLGRMERRARLRMDTRRSA